MLANFNTFLNFDVACVNTTFIRGFLLIRHSHILPASTPNSRQNQFDVEQFPVRVDGALLGEKISITWIDIGNLVKQKQTAHFSLEPETNFTISFPFQ